MEAGPHASQPLWIPYIDISAPCPFPCRQPILASSPECPDPSGTISQHRGVLGPPGGGRRPDMCSMSAMPGPVRRSQGAPSRQQHPSTSHTTNLIQALTFRATDTGLLCPPVAQGTRQPDTRQAEIALAGLTPGKLQQAAPCFPPCAGWRGWWVPGARPGRVVFGRESRGGGGTALFTCHPHHLSPVRFATKTLLGQRGISASKVGLSPPSPAPKHSQIKTLKFRRVRELI